jgi:ATP-dependent HslUV protease ATP-binding subunit HslU
VDQIMRDLVEAAIHLVREKRRADVRARAEQAAEERILDALVGQGAQAATRDSFRKKLRSGELDDKEVEIEITDTSSPLQGFDLPGQGSVGMLNLSDMLGKAMGGRTKTRRTTVSAAHAPLIAEESDKLLDQDAVNTEAVSLAENAGIVFIDEIDKVASRPSEAARTCRARGSSGTCCR